MKARPFDSAAAVHTLPPCNPSITLSLLSFSTASAISVAVNKTAWVPVILRKKRNNSKKRDLLLTFFTGERGQQGLRCGCGRAPDLFSFECNWEEEYEDQDFVVVNFYHFFFINDPEEEVAKHLSFLQALGNKVGQDSRHICPSFKVLDIRGRIYVSQQGFNAQFSGPLKDALAYVKWLREDPRFAGVLFQVSPALNGHAFPRLKLLHKLSLVQLEGGSSHLPLTDPSMRATPLTPFQWKRRLEAVNKSDELSSWNSSGSLILLDVRNGYEWDIGHFHGAQRPDVDCFRSTSFGLSLSEVNGSDPLACIDKEKTDILMYCTGGIRCDIYSTILRKRGFKNLFTLKGGVSHYLASEGSVEWVGNLFVFDSRLSLPPSAYKPQVMTETSWAQESSANSSFARCYICGSQVSELRHRNCANLDCNLLFLCCSSCVNDLKGCCCLRCIDSTRRRPVLPGHQRYEKWHNYRDLRLKSI